MIYRHHIPTELHSGENSCYHTNKTEYSGQVDLPNRLLKLLLHKESCFCLQADDKILMPKQVVLGCSFGCL